MTEEVDSSIEASNGQSESSLIDGLKNDGTKWVDERIKNVAKQTVSAGAQQVAQTVTGNNSQQGFSLWGTLLGWFMNDNKNEVAGDIEEKRGIWDKIKGALAGFAQTDFGQRIGLARFLPFLNYGDQALDMVADVALNSGGAGGGPDTEQVTLTEADMQSPESLAQKFNTAHGQQLSMAEKLYNDYKQFIPAEGIPGLDTSSTESMVTSLRNESVQSNLVEFAKNAAPGFLGVEEKVQGYLAQFNALQDTIDTAQQQTQMLAQNNTGGAAPGLG